MKSKTKKYLDHLRATQGPNFGNFEHFPNLDPQVVASPGGAFKATFNIKITRNSNNIELPLQVGILGFAQAASGYRQIITPPAGATLAVTGGTQNALPDRYRFTYTLGADVDTIDVTCPEIDYPSFLQNSAVDMFRINNIRYQFTDEAVQDQFTQIIDFKDTAIFGPKTSNPLTPGTFINPQDEKKNIVDIPVGQGMDKERCIIHAISHLAATPPFSVNMTFFVEFYDKYTAAKAGF